LVLVLVFFLFGVFLNVMLVQIFACAYKLHPFNNSYAQRVQGGLLIPFLISTRLSIEQETKEREGIYRDRDKRKINGISGCYMGQLMIRMMITRI